MQNPRIYITIGVGAKMIDISGLNFQHIKYFIAIAECGTMSSAAELLHVSTSLLSQKIAQLESIIKIQLFERSKQRLHLTEAGRHLVLEFKDIEARLEHVLHVAQEQYCNPRALTIGFTNYQSSVSVENFLSTFRAQYESMNFTVEIQPRRQLQTVFKEKKVDIIAVTDFDQLRKDRSIVCRIAGMIPIGCYISRSSPLIKDGFSWGNIDGVTCILPEHQKNSSFILDLKRKLNELHINVSIEYHSGDIMTINSLLIHNNYISFAGFGISLDSRIKAFPLGLDYPYIVAHHTDARDDVVDYSQSLYNIIKESGLRLL